MNKYLIPICNLPENHIYILSISASSITNCEEKIMQHFWEYSDAIDYKEFLNELDNKDILIGEIVDIDTL